MSDEFVADSCYLLENVNLMSSLSIKLRDMKVDGT